MKYTTKTLIQTLVYLIIVAGALLMLIPFAWMVDTSFKASSEVSSWPPKWTTKNAKSEVEFQTKLKYKTTGAGIDLSSLSLSEFRNFAALLGSAAGKDTLVVMLDDDPILRGTVTLRLTDETGQAPAYAKNIDKATYAEVVSEFEEVKSNAPSAYEKELRNIFTDNPSDFIDDFLYVAEFSDEGFARRVMFVANLSASLEGAIGNLKRAVETPFKPFPMDNDTTKKLKEELTLKASELFEPFREEISKVATDLQSMKVGETRVITLDEVRSVITALNNLINEARNLKNLVVKELTPLIPATDMRLKLSLRQVSSLIDGGVIKKLENWKTLLAFYNKVKAFYVSQQVLRLSGSEIVGRIRTDQEVHAILMKEIDNWEAPDELKTYLKNNITEKNVRNSLQIMLSHVDFEYKELLSKYFDNPTQAFNGITEIINLSRAALVSLNDPHYQNAVESKIESGLNYDAFKNIAKEIGAKSGQSLVINASLASLDRYANKVDPATFGRLVSRRWKETRLIGEFSKTVSDTFSELEIVKKPDEVYKVYYRGRITSAGTKSFEIKFKDLYAVWFKDDNVQGKVKYTASEVFKNFWQNYVDAWNAAPFGRYYFNTVFVAVSTTFLEIIFAAMAAFAFAKLDFFGKNFLFTLFLATMMVPGEVLLVPNFITLTAFGWIDTYYALIVPWVVSVFAIFLLRQHFMTIPDELFDAAKIDGMSKWKFLWRIMVPLAKPAVITGALLKFVGSWNAFLWVLIVTKSPEYRTLPVGLQNFSSATGTEYNLLMSAATFSIVPVIILFLVTQKYFIAGIARSGLK
ncbi:ABC transporter permease subunit [Kosmotoga sp.]|uniref:carbohydrate ABC transporter permease n=1 Tax=Kosmotoga sp. TaxID=1955248 RepID=UPI0024ABFF07|nr:ABC transporter permease subunit [Kosmotoga sp.]MDI3524110.1 multiple sugar transport system permease protein [Kosmotoga sp.]